MSSFFLENQPSSLPPDLTAHVLILFDVGGVNSMIAEKKERQRVTHQESKRWLN